MGHARKPAVTTPVAILVRGVRMTPLCGISIRTGLSGRRGPGYAGTTGRSGVVPADVRPRDCVVELYRGIRCGVSRGTR